MGRERWNRDNQMKIANKLERIKEPTDDL